MARILPIALAVLTVGLGRHVPDAAASPGVPSGPPAPPPLAWPAEDPIVESEEVGYLPGGGTITASGDYQYTIPIDVPEGRAGLKPTIALRYSSRGGNGIAGVGWSVQHGASEITRCSRTFLVDGTTDSPNHAGDDALCLDGQRLVQINAVPPMSEGAEYRTFRDSFTKIVAHAGPNEAAGSFEAFAKDGTIRVYQALSAFRLPPTQSMDDPGQPTSVAAVWVLVEQRDRSGNTLFYQYAVESDVLPPYSFEARLSSIEYTAKKSAAGQLTELPRRKVVFQYSAPGERPDASFEYRGGVRWAMTRRLIGIQLHAPNPVDEELIGQYTFAYEPDQERSFLSAVHRYDKGLARLWERSFEWAHDDRPELIAHDPAQLTATADHGPLALLFDAENDGRADLLFDGKLCRTTAGSLTPFDACVSGAATQGIWGRPADVNGDGKDDILKDTGQGVVFATWSTDTDSFEPLSYGVAPTSHLIDADGDGLLDAFVLGPRQNPFVDYYDQEWVLRLNTGSGFAPPVAPQIAVPYRPGRKGAVMDLDGDGRGEIHTAFHPADEAPSECAENAAPPWEYHALGLADGGNLFPNVPFAQGSTCTKVLIDLNSDGLRDLLFVAGSGSTVRYNTGTRFLPAEPFDMGGPVYPLLGKHDFEVGDVDGDGREDLVSGSQASTPGGQDRLPSTYLHLRRNGGFKTIDLGAAPFEIAAFDPPGPVAPESPRTKIADVNGDGLADLVAVVHGAADDEWKVRVLVQKWAPHDVITRVWDEPGTEPRESVFYSPFASDSPSPSTCTHPARCLRGGMVTAREHWTHRQDEPGSIRRMAYELDDPRASLLGGGALGFGKVRVVDLDSFAETITYFDHETTEGGLFPFAHMPRDVWRIVPIFRTATDATGGVLLPPPGAKMTAYVSHTHLEYEHRLTNGGATHAVFGIAEHTEEWEQHVELSETGLVLLDDGSATPPRVRHSTRQLDDFGNELSSARWTVGGQRCETVTVSQNDIDQWWIGLPSSRAVTCNQDGQLLPEPRLQTFVHDGKGNLSSVTIEPDHPELSTVTTYDRDSFGLVTKVTVSAQGQPPRTTYLAYDDERVFVRATWNALGHSLQRLMHPAYGVPVTARDQNGIEVRYHHDGFGRVREIDPDSGPARLFSYQEAPFNPWAVVTIATDETGNESHTWSDEWGRTLSMKHVGFDGQWVHGRVSYNRFGQPTHAYRPSVGQAPSLAVVKTFDTLGRVVQMVDAGGATTTTAHGMFESITTDPEGQKSRVARDADDRVLETADLLDGQWVAMTYVYGPFNTVSDVIDPMGNIVHADYDKLGRRVALTDPDRGATTWTYNAFGEVETAIDALGDTTVFERDVLGRVVWKNHDADGATTFMYDGAGQPGEIGRLTMAASPDSVVTAYEYDALGRTTRTAWTVGAQSYDVARTYDTLGRLETMRYPLAPGRAPFVVEYSYNAHGYQKSVSDVTHPASPVVLWELTGRNADGHRTGSVSANGLVEALEYEPETGRLHHVEAVSGGVALYSIDYVHDWTGNVVSRADHAPGQVRTEAFEYDAIDRLTRWSVTHENDVRTTTYGYDLIGNLETIDRDGSVESHEHAGVLQGGLLLRPHALSARIVGGQSIPFGYDARGRQTVGGGREITWTHFDLPAQVSQAGQVTTFKYDAFGVRVRKVRVLGGGASETTDTLGGLYERGTKTGELPRHVFHVHGADGPVAQVVYSEAPDEPERVRYLQREALGSVGLVTDNQGAVLERTYFDPFGEKVDLFGQVTSPLLGDVKLGFTGHRHDDELGLIDMRGRVYDPTQKRFLSPDPLVADPLFGQSFNRYSYVVNNPLRYTDPSGFEQEPSPPGQTRSPNPQGLSDAGAEVPFWPVALTAPEVVVVPTPPDETPPPPPPAPSTEPKKTFFEIFGRWTWGKLQHKALAPAALVLRIFHMQEDQDRIVGTAFASALQGDWAQATYVALELPEEAAKIAGAPILAPIGAALALPNDFGTLIDPNAEPEDRGVAELKVVEDIETIGAGVLFAAGAVSRFAARGVPRGPGPTVDAATRQPVGRFIVDSKGNVLIEPAGGTTVGNPTGTFVETRFPNGSPAQQLHGPHRNFPQPHGHGLKPGPGVNQRGPTLDPLGNDVPNDSPAAHWPVNQ